MTLKTVKQTLCFVFPATPAIPDILIMATVINMATRLTNAPINILGAGNKKNK